MTLQECKDKVAEKHGLTNWENACFVWAGFVKQMEPLMDESAELYAKQRVEEATRWIPVSEVDKLPKKDCVNVAVLLNGFEEDVAVYFIPEDEGQAHRFFMSYKKNFDNVTDQVTHFYILPPLPKAPTGK